MKTRAAHISKGGKKAKGKEDERVSKDFRTIPGKFNTQKNT